jgi:hypothetical protein
MTEESASQDRYGSCFCRPTPTDLARPASMPRRGLALANDTRAEPSEALAGFLQRLQLLTEREADEVRAELRP